MFGPARTDKHGRLLMSDEERRERASAVVRTLKGIEAITDESDTPEIWAEVFRQIDEHRPFRPLFKDFS